jgi:hypothetical protein
MPGWFRLTRRGGDQMPIEFRLPTAADEQAVSGRPDGAHELARRCLRPAEVPARLRRTADTAMEALAPILSGELAGRCPECGSAVRVHFDARGYCLRELRARAAGLFSEVDVLAERYHWSEQAIMAMPSARRARYAELARERSFP